MHALSGIRAHDPRVRANEEVHDLDRVATVIDLLLMIGF
jgi:hypothetical protein